MIRHFANTAAHIPLRTYSMSKHFICLVTTPTEKAEEIAEKLVQAQKCACVNIIPKVTSVYWWQGKVEKDSESLLVIKTNAEAREELIETVKKNHPYEVPEVVFMEIHSGNEQYLRWIDDSIARKH
jgi:periplasmic divalent cation tolerance protein